MSSTDTSDMGMYKMMGLVVVALTLFTLFCMLMARILGGHTADPTDPVMRNALMERIAPVGQIRTAAMASAEMASAEMASVEGEQLAAAADSTASAEPRSGEELYNGACAACHAAGIADAPMLGDAEAWATRGEVGLDALVASAIKGKGTMVARGGSNYSDEEMLRAVKHLTGL